MSRSRNAIQAFIWTGLLLGLAVVLIGLFSSAGESQTTGQLQQTREPVPPTDTAATKTLEPTLVSATTTSTAGPETQPAATPRVRPAGILFESTGELYWQSVDQEGRPLSAVTRAPVNLAPGSKIGKLLPAPDGSQIAYEVYSLPPEGCCELQAALYVFSPPDGQPRQIEAFAPVAKIFGWHPNSQQLIYGGEDGTIGLFDVSTGQRTTIGQAQKWADLPYGPQIDSVAFSPDGMRLIASYTLTGQSWEVWTVNADGSEPQLLFKADYPIAGIAWSPDGQSIAFVGNGVEVISADGKNRKTVGHDFIGGASPAWSPDSRYIVFTAAETLPENDDNFKGYKIRIVDITNGTERNLVDDTSGGEILPVWSPSGSQVLFLSDRSGTSEVWTISLDSAELRQLTSDGQPKRFTPVWLPAVGR